MNTSTLSRSTMPDVSLSIMEESKETIRDAYNHLEQTEYEDFSTICTSIYNNVTETLVNARGSIIETKALLDNTASIEGINELIHSKQEDLDSAPPNEQEEIQAGIDELQNRGDEQVNEKIVPIQANSTDLEGDARNIELSDFKPQVDEEIAELNQELEETINPNIDKYESLIAETQEEYDAICLTMKLMEENGFLDFVSDVIPTPEEIANMIGTGNPEYAAVILALEVFADLVDVVGEGFSYVQMSQARDYLWEQLEGYKQELANLENRKRQIDINLEDLDYINIIESTRFVFTEQVKNLAQSYTIFTEDLQSLMENDVNYDNVLASMAEMITYLENVESA